MIFLLGIHLIYLLFVSTTFNNSSVLLFEHLFVYERAHENFSIKFQTKYTQRKHENDKSKDFFEEI